MRSQKQRIDFQPAGIWENKSDVYTDTNKNNGNLEILGNWPANLENLAFLRSEFPFTLWRSEGLMILLTSLVSKKSISE